MKQHPRTTMMATCTRCNQTLPPEEFWSNPRKKNGLSSHCKSCARVGGIEHYRRNQEVRISKTSAYQKKNRARANEWAKAYVARNRERHYAAVAKWQANNKSKISADAQRRCAELAPGYVANLLGISVNQLTSALLELKRYHITILRSMRNLERAIHEGIKESD